VREALAQLVERERPVAPDLSVLAARLVEQVQPVISVPQAQAEVREALEQQAELVRPVEQERQVQREAQE
jgi:hypothetical protein